MRDFIENYLKEYPNQQQVKMMKTWLQKNEAGSFQFTGLVDPTDDTVITPQATVDYGYNWFSLSEGSAIIHTPQYDKFFSVSIFDMNHNVPAVIVNPDKPILLLRPGQPTPEGDFYTVKLETDQGLAFTRMVVVNNMEEVRKLSKSITMEGGNGDMHRDVQLFSPGIEKAGLAILSTAIASLSSLKLDGFGKQSGDVSYMMLAGSVMIGQLGTPSDTVRYSLIFNDDNGEPLNGNDTYILTIPAGIIYDDGYFSVTVYGSDNKMLIPNNKGVYDRTTYDSEKNDDGTYTVTLSPDGDGLNGIPTGKAFYGLLRAYIPVQEADITVKVKNK